MSSPTFRSGAGDPLLVWKIDDRRAPQPDFSTTTTSKQGYYGLEKEDHDFEIVAVTGASSSSRIIKGISGDKVRAVQVCNITRMKS